MNYPHHCHEFLKWIPCQKWLLMIENNVENEQDEKTHVANQEKEEK
jgi:hypothetical protein